MFLIYFLQVRFLFNSFFTSGVIIPPDITSFIPCSIFIFNFIKSFSGTTNKNPDVGFGVVGKNTFTYFF